MTTNRIVVIGGGLGGLACAAILARAGRRVVVLEKASAPGGRAASQEDGGAWLNLGPHALYRGGAGRKVLEELGVEPAGAAPRVSGSLALDGGKVHALPVGLMSILWTGLLGVGEKVEVARALQGVARSTGLLRGQSVRAWIDATVGRAGSRRLLEALVRVATYSNAPELAAADETVRQLQRAAGTGVLYVDGGWQSIVEALRARAVEAGVEVKVSARAVSVDRGRVGLADAIVDRCGPGGAIVAAAGPAVAAELVPGSASLAAAARGRGPDPRGVPRSRAVGAAAPAGPLLPRDRSAALLLAPQRDRAARPRGPARRSTRRATWRRGRRRTRRRSRRCWTGCSRAGARTWWRGASCRSWPWPSDLHAADRARPEPVVADAPGVLVVGDWVGRGAMLVDASLASARAAADHVLASGAGGSPRPRRSRPGRGADPDDGGGRGGVPGSRAAPVGALLPHDRQRGGRR